MPLIQVVRKDSFTRDEAPKISIRNQHIGFNASFVKKAEIFKYNKVKVMVDDNLFQMGFKFHNDDDPNSWTLFSDNKTTNTRAISSVQLKKTYPFINEISNFKNTTDRQFKVIQDTGDKQLWIAYLCPSFERRISSESELKDVFGIYRYKRGNGDIVYIGKGEILSRLKAPDRREWDFDVVEFSVIADSNEQSKWESYWLDKFIEQNGKLPIYNKIRAGISS